MKQLVKLTICLFLILFAAELCSAQDQKPELIVETGNPFGANCFALSPDGRTLATADISSVKLWNTADGAELRTIVWKPTITSLDFSSDGRQIAVGSSEALKIYDVANGQEINTISGYGVDISFSPDNKTIAVSHGNETVSLWDIKTGQLVKSMKFNDLNFNLIAFSPDGKTIVTSSNKTTPTQYWWQHDFDNNIRLIDIESGRIIKTLLVDKTEEESVKAIAFNRDGSTLVSIHHKTIRTWDVKSGRQTSQKEHGEDIYYADYDADDNLIVISKTQENQDIKLWNIGLQKLINIFRTEVNYIHGVALSRSGTLIASFGNLGSSYSADSILQLWNVDKGGLFKTIKERFTSIQFSPDDKTLACLTDKSIKLLDAETGNEIKSLTDERVLSMKFNSSGDSILTGSYRGLIKLWDIKAGKVSLTVNAHSPVSAVSISPDNKLIANRIEGGEFQIWSTETGQLIQTICCGGFFEFSSDGKLCAHSMTDVVFNEETRTSENLGEIILIRDIAKGKLVQRLNFNHKVSFRENLATVPGFNSGFTTSGYGGAAAFNSPNEIIPGAKVSVKKEGGNQIDIYKRNPERKEISLFSVSENDWLAITPDGLFDGTPNAWKRIIWRFAHDTFKYASVEAFFKEYWRPGLLQEIMSGNTPEPPKKDISAIDIRQPPVRLTSVAKQAAIEHALGQPVKLANAVSDRAVEVAVEVADNIKVPSRADHPSTSGAQDVRLFRNGSLVKLWSGDVLNGQSSVTLKVTVPIVAGPNNFTAYAFNHDNIKSSDATLTVIGADSLKRKGTLHILAVGVSKYANREYNLDYTTDDATSFAAQLKLEQEKRTQYQSVEIKTLLNESATKENILTELKKLVAGVQPEDGVVVYFSGHGKASGDHFYLVPHDLGYKGSRDQLSSEGLKTILTHSISDLELEEAFRGIDAGQMFMIIDACNSGQALENKDEPRRGPMNTRGLAQLAYEKGMYIMTASQNVEEAFVSQKLKHSYLTYALVEEGLKTKVADANQNGEVTLREWFDYALARVPKLRNQSLQSKSLEEVTPGLKAARTQKSQTPRVFYRREPDAQPMIVARP